MLHRRRWLRPAAPIDDPGDWLAKRLILPIILGLILYLLVTKVVWAGPDLCNSVFYNAMALTRGDKSFATRAADTCRLWAPLPAIAGPSGPRVFIPPAPIPPSQPSQPSQPEDALASAGNAERGITRAEVEAAIIDWCGSHADAPLCRKLRVR